MNSPTKESSIKLQTENEHLLFRYYVEENQERKKLQSLVNDLKSQIEILQQQLKCIAEESGGAAAPSSKVKTSSEPAVYSTDEEELAKETEWIRTKTRKKRKLNTSPTQSPPKNDNIKTTEKVKKVPAPPPIIVDNVEHYQKLYDTLSSKQAPGSFTTKILSGKSVKINAANDESYRGITNMLTENHSFWHTYENKQERPIRVMAKKLPFTCSPERIIEDLKSKGYKIKDAVNKLSWKSKEPLNMFMLIFENTEDISKVFEIKSILGCIVEIQALRTSKLMPQCKRCQVYGHTQKYCSKEPRCVKCTGKHLTINCIKSADEKPKCVHCGEAHPANYRGCMIAKEMQKIRYKTVKKPTATRQVSSAKPLTISKHTASIAKVTPSTTYAQAAARSSMSKRNIAQDDSSNHNKLDEILKLMTSFDERLKKIEHSNITAISKPKK